MPEPPGSLMPAAYDDVTTMLGTLMNRRNMVLKTTIDDAATTIECVSSLGDVNLPVYIDIEDELVFCPEVSGSNFVNAIRGVGGTVNVGHDAGVDIYCPLVSKHVSLLRDILIATEMYQGRVGPDASKPATPEVSEVYVASDTKKAYFAIGTGGGISAGAWLHVGRWKHDHLDNLTADDHTDLHNNTRAQAWHNNLPGGHVIDGDTHTHFYGTGAGRIAGGLASGKAGSPTYEREVYYETDTGFLNIADAAPAWVVITGAPSGAIAMFSAASLALYGGACPPGWTRFTALDSRFAVGAPAGKTASLTTVGSDTHSHTYAGIVSHVHTVSAFSATIASDGAHIHVLKSTTPGVGPGLYKHTGTDTPWARWVTAAGAHTHGSTMPAATTNLTKRTSDNAASVATGTSDTVDGKPPYHTVVFCEKS